MWFARGTHEPATSMEVRLLSDLSRGVVPKQIASVLVGFRTRPLWRNRCKGKKYTAGKIWSFTACEKYGPYHRIRLSLLLENYFSFVCILLLLLLLLLLHVFYNN